MLRIVDAAGQLHELTARRGDNIMSLAVAAGIAGIEALCGGCCSCATCHVYVAPAWLNRLPAASGDELALLDFVEAPRTDASRLSCQLSMHEELDGLTLTVPPR
jgi:2Fe-2S ferredoxin